jgi:hypothetical protein
MYLTSSFSVYCLPARVTARRRAGCGMKILPRSLRMVAPLLRRPCASRAPEVSMRPAAIEVRRVAVRKPPDGRSCS